MIPFSLTRSRKITHSACPLAIVLSLVLLHISNSQDREFEPRTVIARPFPAIVEPETVSADQGEAANWVRDDELVLGVLANGKARAYPINTLTGPKREIINDQLGGRSIAATW